MADAEVAAAAAAEATAAAASSSGASATAAPGAVATGGAGTTAATSAAPAVPVKSADAIVDVMILKLDQAPAMAAAYRDIATAAVDDTFRNAFRTAGGFPFFSKGLTTHLSSAEVVVEACKALRLLSRNADNVAALVSQEDGVKSLLVSGACALLPAPVHSTHTALTAPFSPSLSFSLSRRRCCRCSSQTLPSWSTPSPRCAT